AGGGPLPDAAHRPAGADQTGHRRHRRGHRPQRPQGVRRDGVRAAPGHDRGGLHPGCQQIPRTDQQGCPGVRPRGTEGPGGQPHEDRQRHPVRGQRSPVRHGRAEH
ncbi:Methylated-DNA--protein-cysteine methyltransferase, partial [Dysosmobacter welbionis]